MSVEMPVPRRVPVRAIGEWIASSCRLVVRKPQYWVTGCLVFFATVIAVSFVPLVGIWLRVIGGGLVVAFLIALAHTQAVERRISARRALSRLAGAMPTVVAILLLQFVVSEAVELPVLYVIATPDEFDAYAFARQGVHPRPLVDLVHSVLVFGIETVFAFAVPLALFDGRRAVQAMRLSAVAFALSPAAYLAFIAIAGVIPHSLAYLGVTGALAFIAIAVFVLPSNYFLFRSAFGEP
jgi:hypothetical protein